MASLQPWGSVDRSLPARTGHQQSVAETPLCCGIITGSMMAQLAPTVFGFSYPAMYPHSVPFFGNAPALYYPMGSPFLSTEASNIFGHVLEAPCESSNSNGAGTPGQSRPTLYLGDASSRVSLECCGTTIDAAEASCRAAALTKPSNAAVSLCCSESILDPSRISSIADLDEHHLSLPASVLMPNLSHLECQRIALERAGSSTTATRFAAAAAPRSLSPQQTASPAKHAGNTAPQPLAAQPTGQPASSSMVALGTGAFFPPGCTDGSASGMTQAIAGCRGSVPAPAALAEGGVTALVAASGDLLATLHPASSSSGGSQGPSKVPLQALSGGFVWVGVKRYQAIVRRRWQRAKKLGCLVVTPWASRDRKPYTHPHRHRHHVLDGFRADRCPDQSHSEGDDPQQQPEPSDSSHSDASLSDASQEDAVRGDPLGDASQGEAGTQQLEARPPPLAVGAERLPGGAWPGRNPIAPELPQGLALAAWEAELQAVLAEETGVLVLSSEATDGEEAESVGGGGGDGGGRDLEGCCLQRCGRAAEDADMYCG